MYHKENQTTQVLADPFPLPHEGEIAFAARYTSYALGPVMLQVSLKPGSTIPVHVDPGMAAALYVIEGDFINERKEYPLGTSLHVRAGKPHGPHTTISCPKCLRWIH